MKAEEKKKPLQSQNTGSQNPCANKQSPAQISNRNGRIYGDHSGVREKELPHDHGQKACLNRLQQSLNDVEDFQIVSELFKLLGDSSRLRIFWLLCHCEECVINISAMMNMSSPAVSHHLRQLKNKGLISSRREGKEVYYRAAKNPRVLVLHEGIEKMMEIACPWRA